MTESLVNQDTLENADFLFIKKDTIKRGRKERLLVDRFLDVVKRKRSLEDSVIAKSVGMNRSSVWYWKKRHPLVVEKAEKILEEIENIRFDNSLSIDVFKSIPTIDKWKKDMESKPLNRDTINKRLRIMYNVCTYLKTHIDNLNVDQVAELVKEARIKYVRKEKFHRGLSYLHIRKHIRAFFMQVIGISGELLSLKGITAEKCLGWGSQAKERLTPEQRRRLPYALAEVIRECTLPNEILPKNEVLDLKGEDLNDIILEFQNIDYFMFYTATRIKATLFIKLNDSKHLFVKDTYKIKVIDKGKRWSKME